MVHGLASLSPYFFDLFLDLGNLVLVSTSFVVRDLSLKLGDLLGVLPVVVREVVVFGWTNKASGERKEDGCQRRVSIKQVKYVQAKSSKMVHNGSLHCMAMTRPNDWMETGIHARSSPSSGWCHHTCHTTCVTRRQKKSLTWTKWFLLPSVLSFRPWWWMICFTVVVGGVSLVIWMTRTVVLVVAVVVRSVGRGKVACVVCSGSGFVCQEEEKDLFFVEFTVVTVPKTTTVSSFDRGKNRDRTASCFCLALPHRVPLFLLVVCYSVCYCFPCFFFFVFLSPSRSLRHSKNRTTRKKLIKRSKKQTELLIVRRRRTSCTIDGEKTRVKERRCSLFIPPQNCLK